MKNTIRLSAILLLAVLATTALAQVKRADLGAETAHPRVEANHSGGLADPLPPRIESDGVLPIALGLVPPAQFPAEDWDVCGVRLGFVSRHNDVRFLDFGLIANFALGDVEGLEMAVVWNQVDHDLNAIQLAVVGNYVRGNASGLQLAAIVNNNSPVGDTKGFQLACVNLAGGMQGFQLGLFNYAVEFTGLQLGLINYTENISGLQIGLVNVINDSTLPLMFGLNFGF